MNTLNGSIGTTLRTRGRSIPTRMNMRMITTPGAQVSVATTYMSLLSTTPSLSLAYISDRYSSPFVGRNTKTYIWNPATKQSRLIRPCSLRDNKIERNSAAYGFGYDPTHDDFKVVRVFSPKYCAEV